ncbi:hypothetical protein GCM10010406_49170 [Streptomyces thermolineatus]|uniref:Integral membrane protein n=1 Tax=Streptomyces thermolineatus TaxID=44033 RepID=A0ABN3MQY8_9ACTN
MHDDELLTLFDGRPCAELELNGFHGRLSPGRAHEMAHELGYVLRESRHPSRGMQCLVFVRDDDPVARRRAQQTLQRIRSGQGWRAPGEHRAWGRPDGGISAARAAEARAALANADRWSPALLSGFSVLTAAFLAALAVRLADSPVLAVVPACGAVACLVAAVFGPRWVRAWEARNRRVLELYGRQRASSDGLPPPSPLPPPAPGRRNSSPGHGNH